MATYGDIVRLRRDSEYRKMGEVPQGRRRGKRRRVLPCARGGRKREVPGSERLREGGWGPLEMRELARDGVS